jgi:molybdate-binding protein/DNA-binding transcriptional regulator YhcF (GntR family)
MHTSSNISNIVLNSDEAIYLQIADYFRRQVAAGKMNPGTRLPAIRELAQKLSLDPGTIARAYRELEQEGVIQCRRGGGSFVSRSASQKDLAGQQQKRLVTLIESTVVEALGLGFSPEEIETNFILRLAQWREQRIHTENESIITAKTKINELRFAGSHDLAVELLVSHLLTIYPDTHLATSFVGSLSGLMAVAYGEADIAGAHLYDSESSEFNIPFIKRLMPNENVVLIHLVQRVQGLMITRGNPKYIMSVLDLKRPDIAFINRQKGSGTRVLLDSQLRKLGIESSSIKGYEQEEKTHIAVATIIAQGQADVGLGVQSAAAVAGLDFIPLLKEQYDLVTLQGNLTNPSVQHLIDVVNTTSFQDMLRSIPGYDLSHIGNVTTVNAS